MLDTLAVRTGHDGPFPTVTAIGEVDIATGDQLAAPLDDALAAVPCPPGILLDLLGVTFFGSTGIHIVLSTTARARALNRRLAVACGRLVIRPLALSGVEHLVDTHPSRGAASAALHGSSEILSTAPGE